MSVWGYDTDVGPTSVYHFHRNRCSTYAFDMERFDWTYIGECRVDSAVQRARPL